ncbi:MAG TPA: GspH/FimT family pseudopilin [Verrucomicrobiae bacterium]|nr:GspH/FimT family pseudopilin [Verrucomicrobiae bacterium]
MKIRTDQRQEGFSLVELLLTLVLILCLAAASVFTFTALYRSANLDEGYDRFQSLILFAQAEAATTGRKVRLQFVAAAPLSEAIEEKSDLRNIQVTWEADMLNSPGVFQTYTNKTWSEEMVNELVGVEKVQSMQMPSVPSQTSALPGAAEETSPENFAGDDFPSITFYPDGSCDSAEIVLASRNTEDERRVEVRLSGILGSVTSRTVTGEEHNSETLDPEEDYTDLFESSVPVSSAEQNLAEPAF